MRRFLVVFSVAAICWTISNESLAHELDRGEMKEHGKYLASEYQCKVSSYIDVHSNGDTRLPAKSKTWSDDKLNSLTLHINKRKQQIEIKFPRLQYDPFVLDISTIFFGSLTAHNRASTEFHLYEHGIFHFSRQRQSFYKFGEEPFYWGEFKPGKLIGFFTEKVIGNCVPDS